MRTHKPTIVRHDSGLVAEHDMPCAVCLVGKAVLDLNEGIFQPCWFCRSEFRLVRRRWWHRLIPALWR